MWYVLKLWGRVAKFKWMKCFIFFAFYNDLHLNNQKILCLPSIYQFERKLGFWTTLIDNLGFLFCPSNKIEAMLWISLTFTLKLYNRYNVRNKSWTKFIGNFLLELDGYVFHSKLLCLSIVPTFQKSDCLFSMPINSICIGWPYCGMFDGLACLMISNC